MSNPADGKENELQQIIETTVQALRNASETPFTPRAFDSLRDEITEYSVLLISEAVKVAKRHQSETVSSTHVAHASEYLIFSSSRSFYRHMGALGGLLIGVAGSTFGSMFSTNQFTPNGVALTFIAALLGGVLTTVHVVKD